MVELILVESFTLGVDRDVASYLAQKRVKTVEKAATVADNYVLARKESHSFTHRPNLPPPRGKVTHERPLAPLPQGKGSLKPAPVVRQREMFKCTFCGRSGHKAEYCWRRLQPKEPAKTVMTTQGISGLETVTVGSVSPSVGGGNHHPVDKESQPDAGYQAFLSKGTITGSGLICPVNI